MTNSDLRMESLNRLERLEKAGRFDAARAAVTARSPILAEIGLDPGQAAEILSTAPHALESVGSSLGQLEAIVRLTSRPPLIVRNGEVEGKLSLAGDFPPGTDLLIRAVEPLLAGVGRIEFRNHDMSWGGTGWLVQEDGHDPLVVTNRHVAQIVARRTQRGEGVFMFSPGNARYEALIDFGEEAGIAPDAAKLHSIRGFAYLADDTEADIALGRITLAPGAAWTPATLALAPEDGKQDELVAVVGYPASDGFRNDRTAMERYFRGLYEVKRFAPGLLRDQGAGSILGHDCTTLGGNSGSPVISLQSGKVVGLHFAGEYGVGNSAVRASTLRAVIHRQAAGSVHLVAQPVEAPAARHDAAHFAGRGGYDPAFLQVADVPLPKVPAALGLAVPSDATPERPNELRYRNFGILYSAARKMPAVAALNIDGARMIPQKRGTDRWFRDLRIAPGEQLSDADYADPAIDRGHLVRRAATNWGEGPDQATEADADTFHFTVAAPQHMDLNRSATQWLGLEDYVLGNARTFGFRCTVFAGPVLGDEDPPLGDSGAGIPLEFWKVVTMLAEDEEGVLRLHATAYLLSQGRMIHDLLSGAGRPEAVEGFAFGAYRTFQLRLSDLEARTGLDFGPLRDADPMARRGAAEAALPLVVPIDRLEAIVL